MKQRWPCATASCLFEQPILCAWIGEKKDREKTSEERGKAASAGDRHAAVLVAERWPSLAAACAPRADPGGLLQGASTLHHQVFLHAGALLFFKCLFQASSPALLYTNTFLYKGLPRAGGLRVERDASQRHAPLLPCYRSLLKDIGDILEILSISHFAIIPNLKTIWLLSLFVCPSQGFLEVLRKSPGRSGQSRFPCRSSQAFRG